MECTQICNGNPIFKNEKQKRKALMWEILEKKYRERYRDINLGNERKNKKKVNIQKKKIRIFLKLLSSTPCR